MSGDCVEQHSHPIVIDFDGCNDLDNDGYYGYSTKCPTGTDCNDNDPTINLGALEICGDNKDNNCNGRVDEGCCKLTIATFAGIERLIPTNGGSIALAGSISEPSGQAISWTITLPNGKTISGSGNSPSATWDGKDSRGNPVPDGVYTATLSAQTSDGKCTDTKSAQVTVKSSCDLKITAKRYTITPYSGENINISGDITDSSGKPVTRRITLPNGEKVSRSGNLASASWDGKDANGKLVEAGETYSATIAAENSDGCSDTAKVPISISPSSDANSCALQVQVGSSANVASGNLARGQELFSSKGNTIPLSMSLYYNSLDPNNASLGRSWSYSYDISLKQNSDGSILLKEGNWRRKLHTLTNGSYLPQPGDYSTLVKNSDNTFTLTKKDGTKYNFGTDGKIASIVDRNNNAVTFSYTNGNLTKVTDPAGRAATLAYDADNHLSSVIDPSGNAYTFAYTAGTLATVTYLDGGTWRYTYDDKAFMLSKTDPMGNTTTYAYDGNHRVISSTDPKGKTRTITYPTGTDTVKTTVFTEKDGGIWQYTYDTENGTLNQKTDPQGGVTSYTYDGNGNRLSTIEPDGSTTTYTYDAQGNMTSVTDALGQTTTEYTYNSFGQVTSVKDPQGDTTTYTYDANGNLTATTDPTGATTQYQ